MRYNLSAFSLLSVIAIVLISRPVTIRAQENTIVLNTPDTIYFNSGDIRLAGLLWKPKGISKPPAVLYNHGSERHPQKYVSRAAAAFIDKGYAFFVPFRRGQGLSAGHGKYIIDELGSVTRIGGPTARFSLLIRLQESSQLQDQLAGLAALKLQPGIDTSQLLVAGLSFGGMQTMLMATLGKGLKAALNFAGAAMTWERSADIGNWMKGLAARAVLPVYFIQAENDFSIQPSLVLSEEMKKAGKPFAIKIFPPHGTTPQQAHVLIDAPEIWGADVFPVLDKWVHN